MSPRSAHSQNQPEVYDPATTCPTDSHSWPMKRPSLSKLMIIPDTQTYEKGGRTDGDNRSTADGNDKETCADDIHTCREESSARGRNARAMYEALSAWSHVTTYDGSDYKAIRKEVRIEKKTGRIGRYDACKRGPFFASPMAVRPCSLFVDEAGGGPVLEQSRARTTHTDMSQCCHFSMDGDTGLPPVLLLPPVTTKAAQMQNMSDQCCATPAYGGTRGTDNRSHEYVTADNRCFQRRPRNLQREPHKPTTTKKGNQTPATPRRASANDHAAPSNHTCSAPHQIREVPRGKGHRYDDPVDRDGDEHVGVLRVVQRIIPS